METVCVKQHPCPSCVVVVDYVTLLASGFMENEVGLFKCFGSALFFIIYKLR